MPRRTGAQKAPTPWRGAARDVRPMLAELAPPGTHARILGRTDLVFEPKYDGIRALVVLEPGGAVAIYSRRGNDKADQFPEVVEPLHDFARRLRQPLILDGEIVAVDAAGAPLGFQHLQGRLHVRRLRASSGSRTASAALIVFDLLRDGDEDLRPLPFATRRARLETRSRRMRSLPFRLIESAPGNGEALRARAQELGWEGVIAKDPKVRYHSGRHPAWQKIKFVQTEEFVVGGWTDPRQTRTHFGALLLGYYLKGAPKRRPGPLIFAGQVGSGFTQAELERVAERLAPLATTSAPFIEAPRDGQDHWVRPSLVTEVRFTQWTLDGLLRNPVYVRLREDKRPTDIRLPDHRPAGDARPGAAATGMRGGVGRATQAPPRQRPPHGPRPAHPEPQLTDLLETLDDLEARGGRSTLVLSNGSRLPVGNLNKRFWPDAGLTKGDLVRHYLRVAPYALPVVADRPLVMKRFPNGIDGKSFYQHRAPDPLPDGLRVADIREKPDHPESTVPYLIGGTLQTLLYMAQLAVISLDPWFSRLPDIEFADMVALDLDPMPGATFDQVLDVACWLHDELQALGTPCFPKTSGSEGLHIFIPLPPGTPYDAGTIFCQIVATVVATRHPEQATVERVVKRRRPRTIYIDYLQNLYGKTLAAAYSARASPFAGVSTPLTWTEVRDGVRSGLRPEDFTIRSISGRLDRVGDLWAGLRTAAPARLEAAFAYETRGPS